MTGANEKDALLFVGSGSTAGINHLVNALKVREISRTIKVFKQEYIEERVKEFCEVN